MSGGKSIGIAGTDVSRIRTLLESNLDHAYALRNKALALHLPISDKPKAEAVDNVVSPLIGVEIIDKLVALEEVLITANEALIGFNG